MRCQQFCFDFTRDKRKIVEMASKKKSFCWMEGEKLRFEICHAVHSQVYTKSFITRCKQRNLLPGAVSSKIVCVKRSQIKVLKFIVTPRQLLWFLVAKGSPKLFEPEENKHFQKGEIALWKFLFPSIIANLSFKG